MKKHYYGDVFEGMNFQEIINYCWGHIVIGIGKGTGRDELASMMLLYQAYCAEQRSKNEDKK